MSSGAYAICNIYASSNTKKEKRYLGSSRQVWLPQMTQLLQFLGEIIELMKVWLSLTVTHLCGKPEGKERQV